MEHLPLNKVVINVLKNFKDIDYVLYTKIGVNIKNPTAEKLATLEIERAKEDVRVFVKDPSILNV